MTRSAQGLGQLGAIRPVADEYQLEFGVRGGRAAEGLGQHVKTLLA